MEVCQSAHHPGHLGFLPGDANTRGAQLFSLGRPFCKNPKPVTMLSVPLLAPLHVSLLYVSCFAGGVSVSDVCTIPFVDQRGHLAFSWSPQSGRPSVCVMSAGVCLLREKDRTHSTNERDRLKWLKRDSNSKYNKMHEYLKYMVDFLFRY